jgi:hypothetical protein
MHGLTTPYWEGPHTEAVTVDTGKAQTRRSVLGLTKQLVQRITRHQPRLIGRAH